jgi:hypothetical protein
MLDYLEDRPFTSAHEHRRYWLNRATDVYFLDPDPSEEAKDHYSQIALSALDQLGDGDRAAYANSVAAEPTLPRSVANILARDDAIAVAHLVLKLSPALTDDDLTAIAITQSQEHLIAIAERAALAQITTEVLADRGNIAVLRALTANPGAQFSTAGLTRVVDRAGRDCEVADNLARRAVRKPERQAQRILRLAVAAEQTDAAPTRHARQRQLQTTALITDVFKGVRSLDDVIVMVAREDRAFDLAVVLSAFTKLPIAHVLKVLLAPETVGLEAVCRSAALPADTYEAVLTLRGSRLRHDRDQLKRDLESYSGSPTEARRFAVASV